MLSDYTFGPMARVERGERRASLVWNQGFACSVLCYDTWLYLAIWLIWRYWVSGMVLRGGVCML